MKKIYKCRECGFQFGFPSMDTTEQEICPSCRSNNINKHTEQKEINLTSVKTLDEWFSNLPLIYKLDLYNSYSGVITKHLK